MVIYSIENVGTKPWRQCTGFNQIPAVSSNAEPEGHFMLGQAVLHTQVYKIV